MLTNFQILEAPPRTTAPAQIFFSFWCSGMYMIPGTRYVRLYNKARGLAFPIQRVHQQYPAPRCRILQYNACKSIKGAQGKRGWETLFQTPYFKSREGVSGRAPPAGPPEGRRLRRGPLTSRGGRAMVAASHRPRCDQ